MTRHVVTDPRILPPAASPLDVLALVPSRPWARSRPPPPSLVERGTLTARACPDCGARVLALRFAPVDACCRACTRRLEERQPMLPGVA
jgi:hypothetical protein